MKGLLLLLFLAGCKKAATEAHRTTPVAKSETPVADKVIAEADDDTSWIAGTWKKEGDPRWLLFNLPADVAELAGKPARVVRRGKLSVHGRFVSAVFPDGELNLEGSRDHSQLAVSGARAIYRRGAPP